MARLAVQFETAAQVVETLAQVPQALAGLGAGGGIKFAAYILKRGGVPIAGTSETNYLDVGLSPGTTYSYTVAATNAAGVSPDSAPATATTPVVGAAFAWDANPAAAGAQDGSGVWGAAYANWLYGGNNIGWFDHNVANFGVSTTSNCVVTLTNDVTPAGMTFNAAGGGNYTVAGTNAVWTTDGLSLIANGTISAVIAGAGGLLSES